MELRKRSGLRSGKPSRCNRAQTASCGQARIDATASRPGRPAGMPIDGISGARRYDHQDDERITPAHKEQVSPEARQ